MVIVENDTPPKIDLVYLQLLIRHTAMSHFVAMLLLDEDRYHEELLKMASVLLQDLTIQVERYRPRDQQPEIESVASDVQPMPEVMD